MKDLTRAKRRGLSDTTGAKEQELPGIIRAEGRELPGISEAEGQELSGFPEPKVLSAIIKIRLIKLMLIIKLIFYIHQR